MSGMGVYLGANALLEGKVYSIIACHDKSGLAQYCVLMDEYGDEFEAYVTPEMLVESN